MSRRPEAVSRASVQPGIPRIKRFDVEGEGVHKVIRGFSKRAGLHTLRSEGYERIEVLQMTDRDREQRINFYMRAYERVMTRDTAGNKASYTAAYQQAYRNKECMICARPMARPSIHNLLDPDTRAQIGPKLLAHQECLDARHELAGYDKTRQEPESVGEDGDILSTTLFEGDDPKPRMRILQRKDGYVAVCGACFKQSPPFGNPSEALEELRDHVRKLHPGADLSGDWLE